MTTSYDANRPELCPIRHNIDISTCSDANWNLARQWLSRCKDSHDCAEVKGGRHPTRLIQMNQHGESIKMRLRASESLVAEQEYCTLSHCWGKHQFTMLERHNLLALHQDIPMRNLSKTFRHAVLAACKVGFEYIWIDALCIVQDDEEDWQREAATMATVYAHSSLNFAATAATDGTGGCFHLRNPDVIRRVKPFKAKGTGGMYGTDSTYLCSVASSWDAEVERSPLFRRGWVLQERAITPRTLHFGKSQIYWECGETGSCEQFANVIPWWDATTTSTKELRAAIDRNEPWSWWKNVVAEYSRMSLTREDDIFVAISALASRYQAATGDQYIAGLWRTGLERNLTWKSTFDDTAKDLSVTKALRPVRYTAPTWSWGSLCRPVKLRNVSNKWKQTELLSSVVDVKVAASSQNMFGQVASAFIRIRCHRLRRAAVSDATPDRKNAFMLRHTSYYMPRYESDKRWPGYSGYKKPYWLSFDTGPPENLENIYMMGAETRKWSVDIVRGLLLESTRACGEYRRVGCFRMGEYFGDDSESGTCFSSLPVAGEASVYEEVVEPDERGCSYVITLI